MPGRRKRATSPTGQVIEFTWYDEGEPTDEDLDEIFAEAERNQTLTQAGAPRPTIPESAPAAPSAIPAPAEPRSTPSRLLRGATRAVGEAAMAQDRC